MFRAMANHSSGEPEDNVNSYDAVAGPYVPFDIWTIEDMLESHQIPQMQMCKSDDEVMHNR
jgi:hypothetical protein